METDFVYFTYIALVAYMQSEHSDLQETERQGDFMVDYSPLWETMEKKGISQYYLMKKGGIDNKTIYNIKRNENITLLTLERLCNALDCTPDEVISFHP